MDDFGPSCPRPNFTTTPAIIAENYGYLAVAVIICIIGVLGIFGNVNIIIAIVRLTPRMKSSILVGLLAFADFFCIISELQNAIRTFFDVQSYRRECFWAICPYLLMTEVQGFLMAALAFDRLFAFAFPLTYISLNTTKYICCCLLPALTEATFFLLLGALNLNDQPIAACNPPLAYVAEVSTFWSYFGLAIDFCTLSFSIAALIILILKMRSMRSQASSEYHVLQRQKKLGTSCCVMIAVFLFTTCTSHLTIFLTEHLHVKAELADKIQTYMVIFMMLSYSQSFYVYFFCSKLYREAFKKQLRYVFFLKNTGLFSKPRVVVVSVSRLKHGGDRPT